MHENAVARLSVPPATISAVRQRTLLWIFALTVPVLVAVLYHWVDVPLARWARGFDPVQARAARFFGEIGDGVWWIPSAAAIFIFAHFLRRPPMRRLAGAAWFMLLCVLLSGLAVNLFKVILARHRPTGLFRDGSFGFTFFEYGYAVNSFPSGHASTIASAALALWWALPRYRWAWVLMAVVVGVCRALQTAHYASDIVAGMTVAWITAMLLRRWFDRMGWPIGFSPARTEPDGTRTEP